MVRAVLVRRWWVRTLTESCKNAALLLIPWVVTGLTAR